MPHPFVISEYSRQRYLLEIPYNTTAWISKPLCQTPNEFVQQVRNITAALSNKARQTIILRDGAEGPLAFEFRESGSRRCGIGMLIRCFGC